VKVGILFLLFCVSTLADLATGQRALNDGDYAVALKNLLPLAKRGNAVAQTDLGDMYYYGQGVPQDYAEAIRCGPR
jgi:hypothetical protein